MIISVSTTTVLTQRALETSPFISKFNASKESRMIEMKNLNNDANIMLLENN